MTFIWRDNSETIPRAPGVIGKLGNYMLTNCSTENNARTMLMGLIVLYGL